MSLTVGQVQALAVKSIQMENGVIDTVFKTNAYLARLRKKQKIWSGERISFPLNYKGSDDTSGSFYEGAETLALNLYDPMTEISFDLKEIQESLVLTNRDIARCSSEAGQKKLVGQRSEMMKDALQERFTKGIFSDGTAATGALTVKQFVGAQAFLKSSAVNYGNLTSTDVSTHVAYVNDNSSVNRSLTTALDQAAIGGSSEGQKKPTLRIMRQNVMDQFVELLKPYQRTTRESNLNGLGHDGNTLVYSGIDSIIDNLAPANSIIYFNEKFVNLYAHPDFDMKVVKKDDLETMDANLIRVFFKGAYACSALRHQAWLKDISA
jgi:hypothetical protein